jgi:hypothetical protein
VCAVGIRLRERACELIGAYRLDGVGENQLVDKGLCGHRMLGMSREPASHAGASQQSRRDEPTRSISHLRVLSHG